MPPVARITATSRCFISSCVPSSVTVVSQPIAPSGRPACATRVVHDLGGARDAAGGRRVRADDDRAARLDADQNLVDRGRGRIGRRHDRRDDAERLGDFDDLLRRRRGDDADRLHRPDELVHVLRPEQVLLNLVGDDAVGRLFDRQARERLGVRRGGRRHGVDDGVDLGLGELARGRSCACSRAARERVAPR